MRPNRRIQLLRVTHTILIDVGKARASTNVQGIELLFAIAFCNAIPVAHAALVEHVAFAIARPLGDAITATDATFIQNISVAIACTFSDAVTAAHAAFIEQIAIAIARPFSNAVTTLHTPHSSSTLPSQSVTHLRRCHRRHTRHIRPEGRASS